MCFARTSRFPVRVSFGCCRLLFPRFLASNPLSHLNSLLFQRYSDLEKCLTRQVQEFVAKQATLCESLLRGDAEVIQSIRDADTVNAVVAQQLEASQAMSRNLLQRITGILEAPVAARVSAVPTLAPR